MLLPQLTGSSSSWYTTVLCFRRKFQPH